MAVAHAFYCHKRINIVKGAVSIAFFLYLCPRLSKLHNKDNI